MNLSSNPIKKETLNLFKGREKLLKKIESHLSLFDIVLLEGKFGVGKTSLGNYYRFNKSKILTPEIEISTNVNWSLEEFLHVVLKNLLMSIEKSEIYSSLAVTELYKKLDKRYRTVVDKEIQGGAIGINLGVGNSTSRTSIITQSELISDLNELSILCKRKSEIEKPLIIQLNNLDIIEDKSEGVLSFFNSIRNVFQTEGVSWILTGTEGLGDLLRKKLSKMGDLISIIRVNKLEEDALIETFKIRSENKISEYILRELYVLCRGQYRTINNYVRNYILDETYEDLFNDLKVNKEMVEAIVSGINTQKELSNELGISTGKVSTDLKLLINTKIINEEKNGKIKVYKQSPEFFIYSIRMGENN